MLHEERDDASVIAVRYRRVWSEDREPAAWWGVLCEDCSCLLSVSSNPNLACLHTPSRTATDLVLSTWKSKSDALCVVIDLLGALDSQLLAEKH